MRQIFLTLIAVLVGSIGSCLAQNQSQPGDDPSSHSSPAPALTGGYLMPEGQEEGVDTNWTSVHPIVPAMIGGYASSMAFGQEMERSNHVRGGVTVQSAYDDNASASNSGSAISNYSVSVFPQISLDQSRSRLRWVLNYGGGFTFNQRLTSQNQTSQNFDFDIQYRLSPHVNVRASEGITLTTGLFGPVNPLSGSAPGVPVGGNTFVLTPLANQFATNTRGQVAYQFSGEDVVGVSGGFDSLQYRDVQPGSTLLNNRSEDGAAFYMHRLTGKNWLGGSYQFEHLGYPDTVDDTRVHSMILFDTYAFKPSITLSVFGGPQYSTNEFPTTAVPPTVGTSSMWSVAGGATFGWTGLRTATQVSYSHSISDGGGLQGSVQLNSVSGSFRRQIARYTALTFSASYATNNELSSSTTGISSANYASGGVSLTRKFGTHCFVQAGYQRESQQTSGVSTFGNDVKRDLVMASFSYQFARPWGQ